MSSRSPSEVRTNYSNFRRPSVRADEEEVYSTFRRPKVIEAGQVEQAASLRADAVTMQISSEGAQSQIAILVSVVNLTGTPIDFLAVLTVNGKQYESGPFAVPGNGTAIVNVAANVVGGSLPASGSGEMVLLDLANQANTSNVIDISYGTGNAVIGALIVLGIVGAIAYAAWRFVLRR